MATPRYPKATAPLPVCQQPLPSSHTLTQGVGGEGGGVQEVRCRSRVRWGRVRERGLLRLRIWASFGVERFRREEFGGPKFGGEKFGDPIVGQCRNYPVLNPDLVDSAGPERTSKQVSRTGPEARMFHTASAVSASACDPNGIENAC